MPIPKPREGEKKDAFISRCMGNDVMNREFPDQSQRAGVCYSSWNNRNKGNECHLRIVQNANLPVREEMLENQKHLVVPVVMMVDGVHAGSDGPYLYLGENYGSFPEAWNGVPIPVYHPNENGSMISCNSPEVLNEQNVGRLYNVHFDGKLRGDAYINIDRAEQVYPGLIAMLRAGAKIDVSTAFTSFDDIESGEWHGEKYKGIVKGIIPDHLALLPGMEGACNWDDGCGVRANKDGRRTMERTKFRPFKLRSAEEAKEVTQQVLENIGLPGKSDWVRRRLAGLASFYDARIVVNAVSDIDLRNQLQRKINELDKPMEPVPSLLHFVTDVFTDDKYFIYEARSGDGEPKLYKQSFDIRDEVAVPTGEPKEVREERSFVAASKGGDIKSVKANSKEENALKEDRKKKVDELISNEKSTYQEEDREFLTGLDDASFDNVLKINSRTTEHFQKTIDELKAKAPEKKEEPEPKPKANKGEEKKEEVKPVTAEEYIANAPGEVSSMLREGLQMRASKKAALVRTLTANEGCPFTKEQLEAKDIQELESLVALANLNRPSDYSGQGGVLEEGAPKANERQEDGKGVPDVPSLVANLQESFSKK